MLAALALVAGAAALVGWLANTPRLTDWVGSGISMFPNTGIAAIGAAAALLLTATRWRWAPKACATLAMVVALMGAATLWEHVSGVNLGIDTLLFSSPWGNKAAVAPGRMGPPASISFTLLGIALWLLSRQGTRARKFVPILGLPVSMIAALSLMGYISEADPLFAIARYTGIAMQTASILLALALAVIASAPEFEPVRTLQENSAAGLLARRSLPFIIAVPILLEWARLRGQEVGWYDNAMGTSLRSLAIIGVFTGLLWWWVRAVAKHERALRQSSEALQEKEALLSSVLQQVPVGLGVTDVSGKWIISNSLVDAIAPHAIPSSRPEGGTA